MPLLRDTLPKAVIELLMKYDLSIEDADIEMKRLKSSGVVLKVKSARISLLAKSGEH
jgi:hypothetical protein